MLPIISVVIPTFHRRQKVLASVDRLSRLPRCQELEVTVVDQTPESDGASIDVGKAAQSLCRLNWIFIATQNVAAARNVGAVASSSPYIVFMDDDIEIRNSFVSDIVGYYENDAGDVLGCTLAETLALDEVEEEIVPCDWLPTGCLAVKRDDFLAIEGFDENLYRYNEDAELSHRLRNRGLRLVRPSKFIAIEHWEAVGGTWTDMRLLGRARSILENGLYFWSAVGTTRWNLLGIAASIIASEAKGRGRLCLGTTFQRVVSCLVVLPSALAYSFRRPRRITPHWSASLHGARALRIE